MDFMDGIPARLDTVPKLILLMTDDPQGCLRLSKMLAQNGDTVRIIDARWFDELSIEPCNQIVFCGATNRELVVRCYRSDYYRNNWPNLPAVEFIDMDAGGNVLGQTKPEPVLKAAETLSPAAIADPVAAPKAKKTTDAA